jgi:hypothetical protein
MGSAQSSDAKQTVSVVNQAMNNLVTNNTTSGKGVNINTNTLTVNLRGAKISGCTSLNLSQKITANQTVKVTSKFQNLTDLQTQMKSALQNAVSQSSSSTQGSIAAALNIQNTTSEINQAITNQVTNNITTNTLSEVNGFLSNIQNGTYEMSGLTYECAPGGSINITQETISNQTAELLSDALIQNSVTNVQSNSTSATTSQKLTSSQKGLLDGLFSGPFLIIAAVIAVCVVGFIIFKMVSGGGGQQGSQVQAQSVQAPDLSQAQQVGNGLSEFGMQLSRFCGFGVRRRNFGKSTRFGKSRR